MKDPYYKCILITNLKSQKLQPYLDFIHNCATHGITSIQLREKNLDTEQLIQFGRSLKDILDPYDIPLIVNDNVIAAYKMQASGVHVGQTDTHVLEARKLLGNQKIIGLSIDSIHQINAANQLPIDYIGLSGIFPSTNKSNLSHFWGYGGLKEVCQLTHLPVVAVGGITKENALEVMRNGASGIAAIELFHSSTNLHQSISLLINR